MSPDTTPSPDTQTRRVDPFLVAVLKSRFEAIVREMTIVVMKASRSAVIKNAKDLSCAILTYDHRLVSTEDALPIHVMSMDMATRPITKLFDDIKPGDVFLNNCPYTGGTHHADMILANLDAMESEPFDAALLEYLARYFVENKYDLKKLMEHIATSQIYQAQAFALAEQGTIGSWALIRVSWGRSISRVRAWGAARGLSSLSPENYREPCACGRVRAKQAACRMGRESAGSKGEKVTSPR